MALVAAQVDPAMLYQVEELIESFQTRDVAVVPIEYEGSATVAIGYLQERTLRSDATTGEAFTPILLYLPAEMNSAFRLRVALAP